MLDNRNVEIAELRPSMDGVLFVAGYDTSLRVDRGNLVVRSGAGRQKAEGRFSKIARPRIRRLVIYGKGGYTSWEALSWLHGVGASFACIDRAGRIIATSGHPGPDQPALRRAQALGPENGSATLIARSLLTAKLEGQAGILRELDATGAGEIDGLKDQLEEAHDIPPMLAAEARAATRYWGVLHQAPMRFADADRPRIPAHWLALGDRHSPLSGSPRLAVTPAGAVVNYLYALAEFEASLALTAMGLDPGMGWFHRDAPYRASAALDLMEGVRPACDEFLLALLGSRTFVRREFVELPDGQVRLTPVLARQISQASLINLERRVAPVAEEVARLVASSAPNSPKVRTRLTQASRKRGRSSSRTHPERVPDRCRSCGETLADRRRQLCDRCLPGFSAEREHRLHEAGRATLAAMRASDSDPAQSDQARASRASSLSRAGKAVRAWERERGTSVDVARYERVVLPSIRALTVPQLAKATGLSKSYCWKVRNGDKRLHPRHWDGIVGTTAR